MIALENRVPRQTELTSEGQREKRFGANIKIRSFWQRHSQKASGEVFNAVKTGISTSAISPGGAERAMALGETITASAHGAKGYKSDSKRTQETFEAVMAGYAKTHPDAPIRTAIRMKDELISPIGTPEYLKIYSDKFDANKARLLAKGIKAGKYPDVPFAELSPDQQEEIAETAEEPVIREWIDDPESELAKTFPPRLQAAKFATLFDRRQARMAEKLHSESAVDLFHNTHKTATEPFLASGALVRRRDGERITKLEQIGGSLKILDNWESETKTDESGQAQTVVRIRGEEYDLDPEVYSQLVKDGLAMQKQRLTN